MSPSSSAPISIVVMEGDGIGPEITAATMEVVGAADRIFKLGLSFTPVTIGLAALRAQGSTISDAAVDAANAADGVILGPVSHNDLSPGGARRPQPVGRAAQAARPLRQYPPGAQPRAAFRRVAARRSTS